MRIPFKLLEKIINSSEDSWEFCSKKGNTIIATRFKEYDEDGELIHAIDFNYNPED